jgi:hypothetical protein
VRAGCVALGMYAPSSIAYDCRRLCDEAPFMGGCEGVGLLPVWLRMRVVAMCLDWCIATCDGGVS